MDGERYHLRDGGQAGDGSVVCWVLPVTALVDENGPPFQEPVVLILPVVYHSPFQQPLHQLVHRFFDWRALPDGEGVNRVHSACLPWCRAAENLVKLFFCEGTPFTASPLEFLSNFSEDLLERLVLSPCLADFLVVDTSPERQRFFRVGERVFASELHEEGLVLPPEEVEPSIFSLFVLGLLPHFLPQFKVLLSLCLLLYSFNDLLFRRGILDLLAASFAKDLF